MAYHFHTKRIPFSQIDRDDPTYSLTPFSESRVPELLRDSISRVGILHPPILKEKLTNSFQVITGKKRLQVYETLAQMACDCLIIPAGTPELTIFSILLEDILTTRHPTPIEKTLFFQKVSKLLDVQQAAEKFLPLMGLSPNPHHITKSLSLLDLEEPIIINLDNGVLDEKVVLELAKLSFRDRMAIFEIILQLRLSIGKQKKLVNIIRELSARTKTSIADILSCNEVKKILYHPEANTPQKSTNLMDWLTKKRFPRLIEAEKKFRKLTRSLDLPKGANLTHSLSFEKDALTLSLFFENEAQLLQTWHNIRQSISYELP